MQKFKVYLDEKVSLWQRLELVIECESEEKLIALMRDSDKFSDYAFDHTIDESIKDTYLETLDHIEYDTNNASIILIKGV